MGKAEFINIASHLTAMANLQPQTTALAVPCGHAKDGHIDYKSYTFKQLELDSCRIAYGLEQIGIKRGVRTVLMVKPGPDFFALVFALFKIGAVMVLVDPGMGIKNLKQCLNESKPEAFIGIPKAHIARMLFKWGNNTNRINVVAGFRLPGADATLDDIREIGSKENNPYQTACVQPDETAAILFTSGSTGVPKGVVYTHKIFTAQVELLKNMYQIKPGEIDLPTFPLFALFDPALGMTTILPEMDFSRPAKANPKNIINAIDRFGVTNMFGSPAVINLLGRYGKIHGIKLPTLKRVISAGAPVPAKSLERFKLMLEPNVNIHTPYGATESLPVSTISSDEIIDKTSKQTDRGYGICVGRPIDGMHVAIIKITDSHIAEWSDNLMSVQGQIGEIVVKGPVVTHEYFNREENTKLAKIPCESSGEFYHRMGDVGYIDDKGRLWFCGRKSHRVV
ncbi:MAG: fatty acid CoA ligase family protein, partial [Candidatus Anammoxibacter sp.]